MANFGQLILTNLGIQEQYKAQAGTPLKFKRIGMGSGNYSGNIMALTKLVAEKVSVTISKGYIQNNAFTIEGFFSNEGLNTGFAWREIGVFVEDANGREILYCYANAGDSYDYIPATADERYSKYIRIATAIGNATNVSIVEDEGFLYVNLRAFNELKDDVDSLWPSKEKSGELIAVNDSANLPFAKLNMLGFSWYVGLPMVEAPANIASTGSDGNIKVAITGRNLLDISNVAKDQCVLVDAETGSVRLNINDNYFALMQSDTFCDYILRNQGQPLTFAVDDNKGYIISLVVYGTRTNGMTYLESNSDSKNYVTVTPTDFTEIRKLEFRIGRKLTEKHTDTTTVYTGLRFFIGSEDVGFEPYREQVITVSTPNGLPGIPVDSGGNYTDKDGQQWICDEIDLVRGVYVQRLSCVKFNGQDETWRSSAFTTDPSLTYVYMLDSTVRNVHLSWCTHARFSRDTAHWNNSEYMQSGSGLWQTLTDMTVDEWCAYLAEQSANGTPVTVYSPMDAPVERNLTDETIAACKGMTANFLNTTIWNDSGAEFEIAYVPKSYEDSAKVFRRSQFDLLWENASPNSSLAGLTLNLNLAEYSHIMVIANFINNTSSFQKSFVVPVDGTLYTMDFSLNYNAARDIRATNTSVQCSNGRYYSSYGEAYTSDSTKVIPTKIYGIK